MQRRQMLVAASAAAFAPLLAQSGAAFAAMAVDSEKLPILAGGDFATMTSKLALRRGRSAAVASFAALEIDEQAAIADAFGSKPGAAGLTSKQAEMLAMLEAASSDEFDAMYVKGQMTGHQELLSLHKSYASRGSDPMARGASTVAVPSIKTHLSILKGIRASMA